MLAWASFCNENESICGAELAGVFSRITSSNLDPSEVGDIVIGEVAGRQSGLNANGVDVLADIAWAAVSIAAQLGRGGSASSQVGPGNLGHSDQHQFPNIKAAKSQFFDGEDLGSLAVTEGMSGVLQRNGNTRYVMRAPHDVGVDRYNTGLPTNVYTVIKLPDGSVLTMFPGTSRFS